MAASSTIHSLQRGLQVLGAIQRSSAMSFTELRAETGLPKATLVRLLHTLVESGWIRRLGPRGRYVCETAPAMGLARQNSAHDFARLAQPVCDRLQRSVPWPVNLAIRDGASMLILDPADAIVMGLAANYRYLGFRPPMLRSSLGLCYLAFCPEPERNEILKRLSHSTDELDHAVLRSGQLHQRLLDIRRRGYALRDVSVVPPHSVERYGAISVPVLAGARVRACIACSWLLPIASTESVAGLYLKPMQEAAHTLGMTT